jgi:hypothetical protein
MTGVKRSVRQHDEIITAIDFPIVRGWQGYSKVGVRNAMVISVASACLVADHEKANVRIALGSVGPTIIRCRESEVWLQSSQDLSAGQTISLDVANEFGRRAAAESSPIDDHRSTAEYRFIVNHDTKQYVDKGESRSGDSTYRIHPLPLLTVEGNGRGNGDYYGSSEDKVGIWARNTLSVEKEPPQGYSELKLNFMESRN